jgi:hypothetical protein
MPDGQIRRKAILNRLRQALRSFPDGSEIAGKIGPEKHAVRLRPFPFSLTCDALSVGEWIRGLDS